MKLSLKFAAVAALSLSQALPCFSGNAFAADTWGIDESSYQGSRTARQIPFVNNAADGIGKQLDGWSCCTNISGQKMINDGCAFTAANYAAFRDNCPKTFDENADIAAMLSGINGNLPEGVEPVPAHVLLLAGVLVKPLIQGGCEEMNKAYAERKAANPSLPDVTYEYPKAGATPEVLVAEMNRYLSPEQQARHEQYVAKPDMTFDDLIKRIYEPNAKSVELMVFPRRQPIRSVPMYEAAVQGTSAVWPGVLTACPNDAPQLHYIAVTGFDPETGIFTFRSPTNTAAHFEDQKIHIDVLRTWWHWPAEQSVYIQALFKHLKLAPGTMIVTEIVEPSMRPSPMAAVNVQAPVMAPGQPPLANLNIRLGNGAPFNLGGLMSALLTLSNQSRNQ